MKEIYKLYVIGCDDMTVVELSLSQEEYKFLESVCEKVTETSTYSCMPTMEITKEKSNDTI